MAAYVMTPTSIGGTTIVAGNIRAAYWEDPDPHPLNADEPADPVEAVIPGLGTRDTRGQLRSTNWVMTVELSAMDETDLQTLRGLFNPQAGLVNFICTDGGGTQWQTGVRVTGGPRRLYPSVFKVALHVPDPRWQQVSLQTDTQANKQASFGPFTLANAGKRVTRPTMTITADAAKTGVANDFGRQLQGFIVNRAPFDIVNKPVALFDQAGAQARINTAGLCTAAGDDIRVWLDDVPDIPRWIVSPNAAGTEVWINVSLPAGIQLSLVSAMTNVSPANGGSFQVNEDISRLPAKGFVAIIHEGANTDEIFYYASRSGRTLSGIQRAQWGTAASAHATAAGIWANPKRYIVGTSFSNILTSAYGAPPAYTSQRPAIQLPASSNQAWGWGNEADDANTVYFDRANPDRSASWLPGFDADGNSISPLLSIDKDANGIAGGNILRFIDNAPGDGSPPYNNVVQDFAQGILKATSNAILNDWTYPMEVLRMELHLKDINGQYRLWDFLPAPTGSRTLGATGTAAARAISASALGTPASTMYGIKLKGRYNLVAGCRASGSTLDVTNATTDATSSAAIRFRLERDTMLSNIFVLLRSSDGLNANAYYLRLSKGTTYALPLDASTVYSEYRTLATDTTDRFIGLEFETPTLFKAGDYCIEITRTGTIAGTSAPRLTYRNGMRIDIGAGALLNFDGTKLYLLGVAPASAVSAAYFLVESEYDASNAAPINSDQPVHNPTTNARSGITGSFDKTVVVFQAPIYVARQGTFAQTMLHCVGVISNATTGDSIAIDKWMTVAATLAIDCENRQATYTEAGVPYPMARALTPANTADWLTLAAGNNSVSYTEASLAAPGQLDLVSTWRGVK